jgi:hypothetical protein
MHPQICTNHGNFKNRIGYTFSKNKILCVITINVRNLSDWKMFSILQNVNVCNHCCTDTAIIGLRQNILNIVCISLQDGILDMEGSLFNNLIVTIGLILIVYGLKTRRKHKLRIQ